MKNVDIRHRKTLLLLLLAPYALLGCEHEKEGHHEHGVRTLLVTRPHKTDVEITRSYVAQIHATQHIHVRALEGGYLQDVDVDEGQAVKKGDRMFKVMPMLYRAEVQKAGAEAKFAKIEYDNTRMLRDGNVVSSNELAMAEAKLDKAKAESSLAKAHLNLSTIEAPFDGIINRLHARKGSLLSEGELLTTLSDNSQMWVYFNVTESEYLDYMMHKKSSDKPMPVKLKMANNQIFDQDGVVSTIEGEFNHETGTIAFRATFPNPNGLLRHGETGKVLMIKPLKDALMIPQKATFEILDKKFVFVVDEKNTVHSRQITVSEELPHMYVVTEGLSVEDKILVEGLRKVRDGSTIKQNFQEPEAVISKLDVPAE